MAGSGPGAETPVNVLIRGGAGGSENWLPLPARLQAARQQARSMALNCARRLCQLFEHLFSHSEAVRAPARRRAHQPTRACR